MTITPQRPTRAFLVPVVALWLACAPPPAAPPPMAAGPADDQIAATIGSALTADSRLDPADSLYDVEGVVVADGVTRHAPPRFAGVGPGGSVAITSSRIEVRSGLAWAQVEYRWISTSAGLATEGRATFVLVQNERGAWRIRHAHSSSPPS